MSRWINEGRPKGFKVSEESKLKARMNNPDRKTVVTPLGTFDCIADAATAHNLSTSMIKYMCYRGEDQRNGKYLTNLRTGKPNNDCREYYIERTTSKRRRVKTPLGKFDTLIQAANAHKMTSAAVIRRIRSDNDEWQYLN